MIIKKKINIKIYFLQRQVSAYKFVCEVMCTKYSYCYLNYIFSRSYIFIIIMNIMIQYHEQILYIYRNQQDDCHFKICV